MFCKVAEMARITSLANACSEKICRFVRFASTFDRVKNDDDILRIRPRQGRAHAAQRQDDHAILGLMKLTLNVSRRVATSATVPQHSYRTGAGRSVPDPGLRAQRFMFQNHISYSRSDAGTSATAKRLDARMEYLTREGAGENGKRPHFFSKAVGDPELLRRYHQAASNAAHNFHWIASPERRDADLENFARALMKTIEGDVKQPLVWIAAVHRDTEHPHVHIEVAGRDAHAKPVRMHPDYLAHGIRNSGMELLTARFGSRTVEEINLQREREVLSPRFTVLDRALISAADSDGILARSELERTSQAELGRDAFLKTEHLQSRLETLARFGFASQTTEKDWKLDPALRSRLAQLGATQDMLKQLQRGDAQLLGGRPIMAWDHRVMAQRWIDGRVIRREHINELTDAQALLVDGVDGKLYAVPLNKTAEQLLPARAGDIVRISSGRSGHANVYLQTRLSLPDQVQAEARTWLDDKLMTNATRTISAARPGFARTVANSLAARLELLQERGLAHGSTLAPDLMRTLYASELAQFHREEGRRYGLQRAFQPDVAAVGRLEVRDLPSGPHALLIERGGYRLTPLRPQMVSLIGHEVELALSAEAAAQQHRRAARVEVKLATPSQERSR